MKTFVTILGQVCVIIIGVTYLINGSVPLWVMVPCAIIFIVSVGFFRHKPLSQVEKGKLLNDGWGPYHKGDVPDNSDIL
jgi:hypothetical protein